MQKLQTNCINNDGDGEKKKKIMANSTRIQVNHFNYILIHIRTHVETLLKKKNTNTNKN